VAPPAPPARGRLQRHGERRFDLLVPSERGRHHVQHALPHLVLLVEAETVAFCEHRLVGLQQDGAHRG
jgi:hypothetical protein